MQSKAAPPQETSSKASDWSLAFGLFLMVIGGMSLAIRGLGIVGEPPLQILNVPQIDVAEALQYKGYLKGPLRIDGALTSPDPVFMPDTGEPVLRAFLSIHLEGTPKKREGKAHRRTLYRNDDMAPIAIGAGGEAIEIDVKPSELPLFHDPNVQVSEIFQGDKLVKILYGDWGFEVDPEEWEGQDIAIKVDRAYLPMGLKVAVMGALDGKGDTPRLVPFPDTPLEVVERSRQNLPPRRQGLGALAVLIGLGGVAGGGTLIRHSIAKER